MSELAIIAALAKSTFFDVSKQASALANGLQNAAPGSEIKASPNKSVQYLLDISEQLAKSSEACGEFLTTSSEKPR